MRETPGELGGGGLQLLQLPRRQVQEQDGGP
eukprot:CAMPEP_0177611284 /NCGR_PEP_ID=MMETSP0419_2-20121207/20398_1 /TAXON_ID=582737 /ORGANISM="Tetraselmis sp., Strain GSL018" /LENGTH=30 /DNA_ID= /DNA_START= /DNA_END= /DNA_ORIENTATION=